MALGSDIGGVDDFDAALSDAFGNLALAQAILRRLRTPKGDLPEDKTYGYDLVQTVGANTPNSAVEHAVLTQVLAEEEVLAARVSVTRLNDALTVAIQVKTSNGPFKLTLSINALTVAAYIDDSEFWRSTA